MNNTEKTVKSAKSAKEGKLSPENQTSLNLQQALDLAVQHHTEGDLSKAENVYQQILLTHPDHPDALHLLGVVAYQERKYDSAADLTTKALSINPASAEAHNNLGGALRELGKLDEALVSNLKALTIKPDFAAAHSNLGMSLLALGREKEGLEELEWRLQEPAYAAKLGDIAQPMWDGTDDLKGRTILLWAEQGLGDTIKWASCISQLIVEAGHCILEVPPKLLSLFTRSFPKVGCTRREYALFV